MKFLRWLLSSAGYIILALATLILICSPYLDFLAGIDLKVSTLVGVFMGVVSIFVGYFESKIKDIISANEKILSENKDIISTLNDLKNMQNQLRFLSLSDAIALSAGENRTVSDIRIYASTTEVILQIVRDQKIKSKKCKVLIQIFDKKDPNPNTEELNALCKKMSKRWGEMTTIENAEVVRYNRYPTEYLIIMDDRYLIRGRYTPDDDSEYGSNYFHPILFSAGEVESKKYIEESIIWYDTIFTYFKKHQSQFDL